MAKRGRQPIGTTTTTVRTTTAAEEGYDPRPALDLAWSDVANMEPGQALAAAFKIRGISHVQLSKIVRGETRKIHRCTPGDPTPEEFENFVIARWRAGKYELAPVYKGFLLRRRSWVIGEDAGDESGGAAQAETDDVDAVIAGHLKRKSAMVTLREIQAMEKGEGDDDMKSTELIVRMMEQQQKTTEAFLQMERDRSNRLEQLLHEQRREKEQATPAASMAISWEALVPVLLGAAAKLPAPLMSRVLGRVMGVVAPAEKIPEGGWTPDAVMGLLQNAAPLFQQLGPLLQGMLASFIGKPITTVQPDGTPITALPPGTTVTPPPQPAPVPPMPITLSPEGKLALEIAVQHIRDEDYLSAWEALGTSQDTVPYLHGVNPLAKPVSYLPLWLGWLGEKDFMQLRGSVMAFIQWSQNHKAELLREEEEDPDKPEGGEGGGDDAPPA